MYERIANILLPVSTAVWLYAISVVHCIQIVHSNPVLPVLSHPHFSAGLPGVIRCDDDAGLLGKRTFPSGVASNES